MFAQVCVIYYICFYLQIFSGFLKYSVKGQTTTHSIDTIILKRFWQKQLEIHQTFVLLNTPVCMRSISWFINAAMIGKNDVRRLYFYAKCYSPGHSPFTVQIQRNKCSMKKAETVLVLEEVRQLYNRLYTAIEHNKTQRTNDKIFFFFSFYLMSQSFTFRQ